MMTNLTKVRCKEKLTSSFQTDIVSSLLQPTDRKRQKISADLLINTEDMMPTHIPAEFKEEPIMQNKNNYNLKLSYSRNIVK